MLRFALTSLSVVAFGALTAGLFCVAVPNRTADAQAPLLGPTAAAAVELYENPTKIPAAISAGVQNALAAVAPGVAPRDPAQKTASVLLNQDVSVLDRQQQVWREMPKGTNVQVVALEGRFVRVRHAGETMTIPRAALQNGAMKTN